LVDNTFGDKTLSLIQTDYIMKAVKDEKCRNPNGDKDRQRLGLLSSPTFRKSGGKTVNAAHITKASATSRNRGVFIMIRIGAILPWGLYIGKYPPPLGGGNISRCHLGEKI
jgi:hypothetical protein